MLGNRDREKKLNLDKDLVKALKVVPQGPISEMLHLDLI